MVEQQINIGVFCGASSGCNPVFMQAATELGQGLAEAGFGLVYGAGGTGMMGAVSDGALSKGGHVTGVIPKDMVAREWGRQGLSMFVEVDSLAERKEVMHELSSAFVVLPGGFGTLDELFEAITWSQLGYHKKQVYILNIDKYFDYLKMFFGKVASEEFAKPQDQNLFTFLGTVDTLMGQLSTVRLEQGSTV